MKGNILLEVCSEKHALWRKNNFLKFALKNSNEDKQWKIWPLKANITVLEQKKIALLILIQPKSRKIIFVMKKI